MVMFMYKDKVSTKKHGDNFSLWLVFLGGTTCQPSFNQNSDSTSKAQLDVLPVGASIEIYRVKIGDVGEMFYPL